jgi:hypothetical protein
VRGSRFELGQCKTLLSQEDFDQWERAMMLVMLSQSLAVYQATIATGLRGLTCVHGGWRDGGGEPKGPIEHDPEGGGVPGADVEFPESSIFSNGGIPAEIPASPSSIGLKLSVCQKALSLALKHAYVHDAIGVPPVCPVDRRVLTEASRLTGLPWITNWTEVNDMDQYDRHLSLLIEAAGHRDLANWELLAFQDQETLTPELGEDVVVGLLNDETALIPKAKRDFAAKFGAPLNDPGWVDAMLKDALRSSLQHNPTYLGTTPEPVRIEIRQAMRRLIVSFLRRWSTLPRDHQTIDAFKSEMLLFQSRMNAHFMRWFR